jgi:hypothetical protein
VTVKNSSRAIFADCLVASWDQTAEELSGHFLATVYLHPMEQDGSILEQ